MKKRDFEIGIKPMWFVVIGNILFTIAGAYAKIEHLEYSQFFLVISSILFLLTVVLIVRDINRNKIQDKEFWIISMFVFPFISPILYISRRSKMIKLRKEIGH